MRKHGCHQLNERLNVVRLAFHFFPTLCLKRGKLNHSCLSLSFCILCLPVFFCHVLLKLFSAVFLPVRKAALHIRSYCNPNTKLVCDPGLCVLNPFFSRPAAAGERKSTFSPPRSNNSAIACIYSINDSYGNCWFGLPVSSFRDPGSVQMKYSKLSVL